MATALAEFALAATLLILAPGPDSMLVLRNALRGGRRVGLSTAAGTVTGLMSWAVAAALGISALLAASRVGYDALRFAGAAYLVGLGIMTLRRRGSLSSSQPEARRPSPNLYRAYLNGLVSNACNPKIGVFFIAFLPNLMPPGVSTGPFSLVLGAWFAVETGLWLAALVWMAGHAKAWVNRPRLRRRLEQLTGVVLIGFGIRLATESRV
jgi:threonine/homoserine/homoserine lactone efflux protein